VTRSVLLAGILGGVLGGVASFALSRALPSAAKPDAVQNPPQPSEAREAGEQLVAKLQAGQYDEFAATPHLGPPEEGEKRIAEMKAAVARSREYAKHRLNGSRGEFELIRETTLGPSLTRLVYLERFPTGGVVWAIGLFRAADGWRILGVTVEPLETAFPALR
jgi:hypothetical protein